MIFLAYFILSWFLGFILIDWKNWRLGYPTALFGSLGSFILDAAFVSGGFWSYFDPLLPGMWPNITLNLGLYPVGAWVYVQRFPSQRTHQILWIFFGVVILLIEEVLLRVTGHIYYHHGWNLGFSALANIFLLGLLKFHFNHVELRSPYLIMYRSK